MPWHAFAFLGLRPSTNLTCLRSIWASTPSGLRYHGVGFASHFGPFQGASDHRNAQIRAIRAGRFRKSLGGTGFEPVTSTV